MPGGLVFRSTDASRDFGGLVERAPRELIRVRDVRDVVDAVTRARRERCSLAARGQGHSTRGHALSPDGLVLSMEQLNRVVIDGNVAIVGAGARWDQLVRAAWLHGLTPPVLPDYLGLSVGGTLSVGGFGGASFRHGAQTDQLLELTVVTGRGELCICSPDRDAAASSRRSPTWRRSRSSSSCRPPARSTGESRRA